MSLLEEGYIGPDSRRLRCRIAEAQRAAWMTTAMTTTRHPDAPDQLREVHRAEWWRTSLRMTERLREILGEES